MPNYSVTKAAVLSLSRLVADLYAKDGIRSNAIAPVPTATEAWLARGGLADQQASAPASARGGARGRGERTPLGRLAEADEIASVVVFLCLDRADYVTGSAWSVDGGTVPIIIYVAEGGRIDARAEGRVADAFEARIREQEDAWLSPHAVRSYESRGRAREEDECRLRTPFQRDRDRSSTRSRFAG